MAKAVNEIWEPPARHGCAMTHHRGGSAAIGVVIAALLALSPACYHYHIKGNRVTPTTEARSHTRVAYLWGLIQPEDIVPENCPRKVPLAEVSSHTNLGYLLIGTLTLGTVLIHRIEWRCASYPTGESNIL